MSISAFLRSKRRTWLPVVGAAILASCAAPTTAQVPPAPKAPMKPIASTSMARNPIIWADVPDIAIIRVGGVYYMSSTTAHMAPGVPIMKSTDLVNWKMVGYVYQTLGDSDALSLKNGKNAYSGGSWASSLRYHNGTFYLSTFSGTTGKTYIYETKDIENGPWTEHEFEPKLHDHTLFFDDDGRVYMIYGGGEIKIVELNSDMSGLKPGGVNQTIIRNASLVASDKVGLPAEGSQMMKVNGKYYLFNIVWPPGGMRTEIVHRADSNHRPLRGPHCAARSGHRAGQHHRHAAGQLDRLYVPRSWRRRARADAGADEMARRLANFGRQRQSPRNFGYRNARRKRRHFGHRRFG